MKHTERVLLDALYARLSAHRGGTMPARSVVAEHVRLNPAWGHTIADAISIDTWASGGYALHGYEVKVTRSDWRRELVPYTDKRGHTRGGPEKSAPWRAHCTYWWIVTPDPSIVRDDLPPGWGLLTLQGRWLREHTKAAKNLNPEPLPPAALAGLIRATAQTARYHALTPVERLLLERDHVLAERYRAPQDAANTC